MGEQPLLSAFGLRGRSLFCWGADPLTCDDLITQSLHTRDGTGQGGRGKLTGALVWKASWLWMRPQGSA